MLGTLNKKNQMAMYSVAVISGLLGSINLYVYHLPIGTDYFSFIVRLEIR